MKTEELADKWAAIKKILITEDEIGVRFQGELIYIKNDSATPIHMSTVANLRRSVGEHDYDWGPAVSNSTYPIMPGEKVGPIFGEQMFFSTLHGNAYLTIIVKEVR